MCFQRVVLVGIDFHCLLISCPYDWTSDGGDGREVMSFAQEPPLTELCLVPTQSDFSTDVGCYYSAHEHVRVSFVISYMPIYSSHNVSSQQRPRGQLNVAEGTDPHCSWAGVLGHQALGLGLDPPCEPIAHQLL